MINLASSLTTLDLLAGLYWGLTAAKLLQYGASRLVPRSSPSSTTRKKVEYVRHLQIAISLVELLLFQNAKELAQVPRQELRAITDPWIQAYNQKASVSKEGTRRLPSLYAAKATFYKEFCQETNAYLFMTWIECNLAFHNHPLGLMGVTGILLTAIGLPLLLTRELVSKKGTPQTLLCKIAAAATIVDVYVVCVKENLDFETAIQRYPFASELFHNQYHPLIGRAVCPVYKRKIAFPKNDVLDFDYEFVAVPKGMGYTRQKHHNTFWDCWERLNVVHFVILLGMFHMVSNHGVFQPFAVVAPSAVVFYFVRTVVDGIL